MNTYAEAELRLRATDPLRRAFATLTTGQRAFVVARQAVKAVEGGNQSGKSWSAAVDFLMEALGTHPTIKALDPTWPTWKGWWTCVSYELFGLQVWGLWKQLLLFPGETVFQLPTRRILAIGWHSKSPEIPNYVQLRRDLPAAGPGPHSAEIWLKSYEQGRGPFQSGEVNRCHEDEEAPEDVHEETLMRTVKRAGINSVSATPWNNARYLERIRHQAPQRPKDIFHCRIATRDNPMMSSERLRQRAADWADAPELLRLRLEGYPVAMEGLIYKDNLFTAEHVCAPFDIPRDWCRFVVVDHGWRHCVALWFALAPGDSECALYREYHGTEKTVAENVAAINGLCHEEAITARMIDRATLASAGRRDPASGEAVRVIDEYSEAGFDAEPSPFHGVWAGIAAVWRMLKRRNDVTPALPWFRAFNSCVYFLEERRTYRSMDAREGPSGEGRENPVKKEDHAMDAWRYFVAREWHWRPPGPMPLPPKGTLARAFMEQRRRTPPSRL